MAYTIPKKQPKARAEGLGYDDLAPGLYPGETAIKLDTGELVAVAASSRWLQNGAGVSFKAWGRQITPDGTTVVGPEGQEILTSFIHSENPVVVEKYGLEALSRETLMAVLGEPPTMVKAPVAPGEGDADLPMIGWSDELRKNVSIRVAIAHSASTNPLHDVGSLLK